MKRIMSIVNRVVNKEIMDASSCGKVRSIFYLEMRSTYVRVKLTCDDDVNVQYYRSDIEITFDSKFNHFNVRNEIVYHTSLTNEVIDTRVIENIYK